MKSIILIITILFCYITVFSQTNEKRIALIIGNSAYLNGGALKNPVNDANLMATTLKSLGFEVILKTNANLKSMQTATVDFTNKIANYDVALFFYAGHGIQINGENYLIPVDAKLDDKASCQFEAFNINFINNAFQENQNHLNVMILDACRNNPFRSWMRGGSRGFQAIKNQAAGTIIAFATREGETASDGDGNNGLFTEKLVKQMKKSQNITEVFQNTRVEVLKASENTQCPQEWNMLTGNFCFFKGSGQQQNIVEENPVVETNQTKNNNSDFMITEEVLTGTIKITSLLDDDFYFDGQLKGKFSKGRSYTLNNIEVGRHELKVGKWHQTIDLKKGDILEISTELYYGSLKIVCLMDGDCYIDNELKGKFTQGEIYDFKNILEGNHELKVGNWKADIKIDKDTTIEIRTDIKKVFGTLTDQRDNKTYKTVTLGKQTWMVENLAFQKKIGCWAYDKNQNNVEKYGYLYKWETAQNVCPAGWHLPSKEEFETLLNNVGRSGEAAYKALLPSGNSGFSSPFGGCRDGNGDFNSVGIAAYFWSSSPNGVDDFIGEIAWELYIGTPYSAACMFYSGRSCGYSVRCLQDN
jgi:uncharacterized protein (TIGR02145 family)